MAKEANDAVATQEKKSKRKRKNTSRKSDIFVRNYSCSFLSPIHWLVAFQSKASKAICRKSYPKRMNTFYTKCLHVISEDLNATKCLFMRTEYTTPLKINSNFNNLHYLSDLRKKDVFSTFF